MAFLAPVAALVLTIWLLIPVMPQPDLDGSPILASETQSSARWQTSPFHCKLHACVTMQFRTRLAETTSSAKLCMHIGRPLILGLQDPQVESTCLPVAECLRRLPDDGGLRQRPNQRRRRPDPRARVRNPLLSSVRSPLGSRPRLAHPRERQQDRLLRARSTGWRRQRTRCLPRPGITAEPRRRDLRGQPSLHRWSRLGTCLLLHWPPLRCPRQLRQHSQAMLLRLNTSVPWLLRLDRGHQCRLQRRHHSSRQSLRQCPLSHWEPGPHHQWSRPDLRLLKGRSRAGALLFVSSPSSPLLDVKDPAQCKTSRPHCGLSSRLAWAPLLGHRTNSSADACGCQKVLPLLFPPALHFSTYSLAPLMSLPWTWTRVHSGRACSGWNRPAAFSSELNPDFPLVLAPPTAPHAGPCAGLRSPRLSQPEPHTGSCPCKLYMLDRCSRPGRLALPRPHHGQARVPPSKACNIGWQCVYPASQQRHKATPLPQACTSGSPVLSRQQPSRTGVSRHLLRALHLAVCADMPKSPSKRERERSRPGRLNSTFTDRGLEDPPERATSRASAAREEEKPPMSQQERRWQKTPPPFTVYSEVYYCYGKLPQPSPALDRILQELLEQQEAGSTATSRPRITLKSRENSRRRAKAEIITKRLEAQDGGPPRPRSLPPRPRPPSRRSRSRSKPRPCSVALPSASCRQSGSPPPVRRTEVPHRPTKKPTPKRCPLPPPDKIAMPTQNKPSTPCKDRQPQHWQGPQDSEYTYYSSEEEGSAGQAKLPDYPAGSLISRLLPTSTATAASSETGSYESSRSLRSAIPLSPQARSAMHELTIAAACYTAVAPSPTLTRFHPGLATPPPDELFEGLIPGPAAGDLTTADTTEATHTQTTPIIEVEDDSPREHTQAPDAGAGPDFLRPAAAAVSEDQETQTTVTPAHRGGLWLSLQLADSRGPIDLDDAPLPPDRREETLRPAKEGNQHRPTSRRQWKGHTLGKALLPRWRQTWRAGFQRAYRTLHSARSGLISDVPSLLWLARRFHRYYPRPQWPDIHAALQRLIGTPAAEKDHTASPTAPAVPAVALSVHPNPPSLLSIHVTQAGPQSHLQRFPLPLADKIAAGMDLS